MLLQRIVAFCIVLIAAGFGINAAYVQYEEKHVTSAFRSAAWKAFYAIDRCDDLAAIQVQASRRDEASRFLGEAHSSASTRRDKEIAADLDFLATTVDFGIDQLASGAADAPGQKADVKAYRASLRGLLDSNRSQEERLKSELY